MSHFAVAIITKGQPTMGDIAAILEPYDENKEVLHYTSQAQLIAKVRADIKHFEETTYAEYLKDKDKYVSKCTNNAHIKYITEDFPKKLTWTDEECYQDAIKYVDEEDICEDGSVRSTYNPDSKWDWFEVGGRWAGYLTVKGDAPHLIGGKSWTWGETNPYDNLQDGIIRCDGARIKDLIFLNKEKDAHRAQRFWEIYVEGDEPKDDKEREMVKFVFHGKEYFLTTYKDKESYIRCYSAFSTYAVVTKDGKWHAQGEMGWWGMSNDNDVVAWHDGYQKLVLDNADEDDYITIVDCHI